MHFNPLNAELNQICHLLTLIEAHHILHISRTRIKKWLWIMDREGWRGERIYSRL